MIREAFLALMLSVVAVAGCLSPSTDDATPADAPAEGDFQLLAEAGAVAPAANATNATNASAWWMLAVDAAPAGGLAAAWWTVPAGAVVPWAWNEMTGLRETTVALEVAPVVADGGAGAVEAWTLLAFALKDGKLWQVASLTEASWTAEEHGPLAGDAEPTEPQLGPRFLRLGIGQLSEGDRVGFVLAARAPEPVEVGLAFRALDRDPDWDVDPIGSWEAFREARGGIAPVALPLAGEGTGQALAAYLEFNLVRPPFGVYGYSVRTGDVAVDGGVSPDLRPLGGHRAMRVSAASPTESGWTSGMAMHLLFGEGAGEWSARGSFRGEEVSAGGIVVATRETQLASWLLFGLPLVYGVGEGDGASATELSLDLVGRNEYEVLVLEQDDLGARLADLLGEPAGTGAATYGGLLGGGGVSLVALRGDDLVTVADGVVRVLGGALAGLPDEARAAFA